MAPFASLKDFEYPIESIKVVSFWS
jgi:hypothetical protein